MRGITVRFRFFLVEIPPYHTRASTRTHCRTQWHACMQLWCCAVRSYVSTCKHASYYVVRTSLALAGALVVMFFIFLIFFVSMAHAGCYVLYLLYHLDTHTHEYTNTHTHMMLPFATFCSTRTHAGCYVARYSVSTFAFAGRRQNLETNFPPTWACRCGANNFFFRG